MSLPLTPSAKAVVVDQWKARVVPLIDDDAHIDFHQIEDDRRQDEIDYDYHEVARRDSSMPYVNMEMSVPPKPISAKDNFEEDSMASVVSEDGIQDVNGYKIICMVVLLGDMARGVVFPSLWHLVQELGGGEVTLGYAVAAISFGRMISNPIFGSWSVSYGYKFTLTCTTSILLFGTILYAQAQNVGTIYFLILAQTVLGIGSGTLGVTRAYVADVTSRHERTTYMAIVTAVQYGGFTVTPIVGAFFNIVLRNIDIQIGWLRINLYTAPAYFLSAFAMLVLYCVVHVFQERERIQEHKDVKDNSKRRASVDQVANYVTFIGFTIYECCLLGCMLLNVATKGSIASFETLGVAYAESHFLIDAAVAGTIVATCGSIGVIILLSMSYLVKHFTDVQLISGGLVVMATSIVSLTSMAKGDANPKWRYVFAIFMIYSIGYPVGHTVVIALFSKIVGKQPQGILLGWFASTGSLARIVFPIMSGYIAGYTDVVALFWILSGILVLSTIFVLVSKRTLNLLSS